MYSIVSIKYHYYYELAEELNTYSANGFRVIQVLSTKPSGDNEKMHLANVLSEKHTQ